MNAACDEGVNPINCNLLLPMTIDIPTHTFHRPEIIVEVFSITQTALVDTGATISAISEEFLSRIKDSAPMPNSLPILPVTGVTISTTVRGRSRKITRQVLIPLKIFLVYF